MRNWRGDIFEIVLKIVNMMMVTRLLLSVLPQHVAVEMKGDIMSPVEVCTVENTHN